jgi:hypothetical protein
VSAELVGPEVLDHLAPPTWQAATWNVYKGTPPGQLEQLLRARIADGVGLFLFQELSRPDVRAMIRDHGLRLTWTEPQYGIGWAPELWSPIGDKLDLVLSRHGYFTDHGAPMVTRACVQLLADQAGRTVLAASYHTPPHVQAAHAPAARLVVLRDSMATLRQLRRHAHTTGVLAGGDDNVDEHAGLGSSSGAWRFMLRAATGLRQVQAPAGTHGRRRIDDFRVAGLRPLEGSTHPGGGDHRVHVRRFGWRATR